VLIGANGNGKTSVLAAFSLLANSAQGKLSEALTDLGGLPGVLTYDRAEELHIEISMGVNGHEPLEYSLRS
jgi:predicted ATPase